LVGGYQDVEALIGSLQQGAVLYAGPTAIRDGRRFMDAGE